MKTTAPWRVSVDDEQITALYEAASGPGPGAVFVCAHGAGGRMDDRGMASLAGALRAQGFDLVRFNFLYREKGAGRPDPMPRLKRCIEAVVAHVRSELAPALLIIGGRSMGGRVASMLAADGFACDGLLLAAYPLHPAGRPDQLRDAHLPHIRVPALCLNGTRDALCTRELMERAIAGLSHWSMHWLEGADHSFHVLKSSGRTDAQVLDEIGEASRRWLETFAHRAA
jgi:predicted alpha/beta-hydrolase family hydrolase